MTLALARDVATELSTYLSHHLRTYYHVNPINDYKFAVVNDHRAMQADVIATSKWATPNPAVEVSVDGSGHAIIEVFDIIHDKDILALSLDGASFVWTIHDLSPHIRWHADVQDAIRSLPPGTTWATSGQTMPNKQGIRPLPRPSAATPPAGVTPYGGIGGIAPPTHRQLVVYESADATNHDSGRLLALDPGDATGVPVPAFSYGAARPATGSMVGQAFISTVSGIASVWDGRAWTDIAVPVVAVYDDDAKLLADAPPDDTVAISSATGNFFVRVKGTWKALGVQSYPTAAGLIADQALDGTIALARDTRQWFVRINSRWTPASSAIAARETDITANNPPWNFGQDGSMVVAQDTGRMFVRANGVWTGSPIRSYTTEALLLADTPSDGVLALAQDTGLVYARIGGNWVRVNSSPTITVGTTEPTTPTAGDIFHNSTTHATAVYDGTSWQGLSSFRSTVGRSGHANPQAGDIYWDTDRGGFLNLYDGSNWISLQTAGPYLRQDADPGWGSSNYGRIWEDTDGGAVYIAAAHAWQPMVQWMEGSPSQYGLRVPGYFSKDPDDTHSVDDTISIKARYYSGQFQLFGRKGGGGDYHALMAHPSNNNGDKLVLMDAEGYPNQVSDLTYTQLKAALPTTNVATGPADKSWLNQPVSTIDGKITVFQATWLSKGNSDILIAIRKTGGQFENTDVLGTSLFADYNYTTADHYVTTWYGGGGGGGGWYAATRGGIKQDTIAFCEITVDLTRTDYGFLRVSAEYRAWNDDGKRTQMSIVWDKANTVFRDWYFSRMNNTGNHEVHIKQIA